MDRDAISLRSAIKKEIEDQDCIDLEGVSFISRAVADELTAADVTVKNVKGDVREMLLLVSDTRTISEFNEKTT